MHCAAGRHRGMLARAVVVAIESFQAKDPGLAFAKINADHHDAPVLTRSRCASVEKFLPTAWFTTAQPRVIFYRHVHAAVLMRHKTGVSMMVKVRV